MKKTLFFRILLIFLGICFCSILGYFLVFYFFNIADKPYAVFENGEKIALEIARTSEEKSKGLSGRNLIEKNKGMYFYFPEEGKYGFWMKDMNFPIDIVWIKGETVVGVEKNILPETGINESDLKIYRPPENISGVLELAGGVSERIGILPGSRIKIIY